MPIQHHELRIPLNNGALQLHADLYSPSKSQGLVLLVHGYGSSRHSPRNRHVAGTLQGAGLSTLLFDFLATEEDVAPSRMFDARLLGERLLDVTRWVKAHVRDHGPLGYFGATTGAAASLIAAAELGEDIAGIVSRGGRPDLASDALPRVQAPTLFIVGEEDPETIALTKDARELFTRPTELEIIPGATHFFKESGALEAVSHLATDWFLACFRHSSQIMLKRLA